MLLNAIKIQRIFDKKRVLTKTLSINYDIFQFKEVSNFRLFGVIPDTQINRSSISSATATLESSAVRNILLNPTTPLAAPTTPTN